MNKNLLIACSLAICLSALPLSAASEIYSSAPATKVAQEPIALAANRIENIYCTTGAITSLEFVTDKTIEQIKIGSPIVAVKFDSKHKILDLLPKVSDGRTNMNIVVNGATYVFIITISPDANVDFRRTYTFSGETEAQDAANLEKAPRMKPGDIDVMGAITTIENARVDPFYREKLTDYRMLPINKIYQWNGNLVHLLEAHQFVDKDLLVLKVQWLNETHKAYYLKDTQYQVWLANKDIPVTARMQATDGTVYPGQLETVWLFVQGYRLSINNDWELKLPPESSSVRALFN
jgi:hypothetical protein